ncbi:TonB-dependent receptor [Microbulbifer halophilus]|uniref:TonB-dependent receptor n=1 Tax=Microbulbifer halophilus TaxID=453963 RepID=A0ABW5E8E1_9GAMM|nr:TonB-dependent receptor [Microbulbifer halophilus]MCW8125413.1 TonB-dependent receptor [Microbulbifer halophilus]
MSLRSSSRKGAAVAFAPNPLCRAIAFGLTSSLACFSAAAAEEPGGLEEVMVMGEKTERSLQDTVSSVRVVTAEDIEEQDINDFHDVLDRTPNVSRNPGNGFNIRGIDVFSVSGGGNSYLASVYSDGAPLPYRLIQKIGFSTWDVQQVEVLRGPQSTLQGRNALAGAIVMNTQDPSYEWGFKGRLGLGEEGREEKAVAFGGGLVEDQLALRVAAEQRDFDGYIENTSRGENSDFKHDETLRLKLLAEPDALPNLRAMLTLTQAEMDNGVDWSNSGDADPFANPHTTFNDPMREFIDSDMAVLKMNYDLGANWALTSTTTYSDVNYGYRWDGDQGPEPGHTLANDRVDQTLSQEFLLSFDFDRLRGVVGSYYSDLDVNAHRSGAQGISFARLGVPTLLMAPPEFGGLGLTQEQAQAVLAIYDPLDPVIVDDDRTLEQGVGTVALFADLTYRAGDQLDLFAGLRYDRERQGNANSAVTTIVNREDMPDPPNPAFDPVTAALVAGLNARILGMADAASGTAPLEDEDFDALLPKAGAIWHWSDDISTSFTAQKGYRSGGVGANIARATTYSYDPEYTWNYELSLRSLWMDGRLAANASLFYLDWEDQQVTVQLSSSTYDRETLNSGSSTVKGAEVELLFQADEHWSGYAGLGYSKTEFEEFEIVRDTTTYDLSGRSFVGAPEVTANLGATYRNGGLMLNANANYRDESATLANPYSTGLTEEDPDFDPKNDARTLVNLRAGYEWDNLGAFLTVRNLFDEGYIEKADWGGGTHYLGQPRLATLRLEADF